MAFSALALLLPLFAGCDSAVSQPTSSAPAPAAATAPAPPRPAGNQALITRGKYLAAAADCAACHTNAGGAPWAGGFPMDTGFGIIYGTNISPDKKHGIGNWSADDFYNAIHAGKSPGGHYLYPAMPYTSYHEMSREDSDAIYAYLMNQKPIPVENLPSKMTFPFNVRFGMVFWNLLFVREHSQSASQGQSAAWVRGRYLTNTLGHCGECHTPRGFLRQMKLDQPMTGYKLGRYLAPDITPQGLSARGWTPADLQAFLRTGLVAQGSTYDEMHVVVKLSTSKLTDADLAAMTTFLMGEKPLPAQARKAVAVDAAKVEPGRRIYLNVCAGCHGAEGQGKPHVTVAMRDNTTVRLEDPNNLLASVLDGLPEQEFPGLERMQNMPGFATALTDAEMADLSNYLRATWGGLPANVTPAAIAELRKHSGHH
jgi:mono/diheme cytochrome c family protein